MTDKVQGVRIKAIAGSYFDAASQSVNLITILLNDSRYAVVIPRGIVGVMLTAIHDAMSHAPPLQTEENQFLELESVQALLSPDGLPTLTFYLRGNVRLPITMTPDLLPTLKVVIADLEKLSAPRTSSSH